MRWSMRLLVSALFLFSGSSALIYQVAWTRELSLVFGASYEAISIVLSAFMAGLALGSVYFGRRAERLRRPLRAYGFLEFGIAAAALILPVLLALMDRVYVGIAVRTEGVTWWLNLMRVALAFSVLVIPTFFMGGTLPVLTRFVVRRFGDFGPRVAWLYAINTAGAVLGATLAGFVLLRALGVHMTQLVAVLMNVGIGAVAILADSRRQTAAESGGAVADSPSVSSGRGDLAVDADPRPWALHLAFYATFVSGLCALALEVMWTRGIGLAMGTTTYSFTIMLATFLIGITLGSSLHAWFPLRRIHESAHLGVVFVLIGVSSAAASQWIPQLPQIAVELNLWLYGESLGMRTASTFLLSFAMMLIPATLMGIAFPLAGRARARLNAHYGRSVGELIGLNTLGGILGPLVAGFVMIPTVGLQRGMLLVCGLYLGVGLALLLVYGGARKRAWPAPTMGLAVATAVTVLLPRVLPSWDLHTLGAFQNNISLSYRNEAGAVDVRGQLADTRVLYYREGRGSTVSVAETHGFRALLINGKSVATDQYSDLQHEYLLGHLPVLLHADPKSALVIGLGAGLTLGGVAAHESIDDITLVEIEPAVLGAARVFEDINGRALDDKRLQIVVQDGRNYVLTTNRRFDVITADPIHPWAYGAAYLYTKEYYALIAGKLNEGGIMCQWMPLYELSDENLRSITRSFAENFAHTTVWQTTFDAVLIGSDAPLRIDLADLAKRLQQPRVATQLSWVGLDDPLSFLAEFTMDEAATRAYAEGAPLNTDDNLYLEFSSPLSIGALDGGANMRTVASHRASPRALVSNWSEFFDSETELDRTLETYRWAKGETVAAEILLNQGTFLNSEEPWHAALAQLQPVLDVVPQYGRARTQTSRALTGLGQAELTAGDSRAAISAFRAATEVAPRNAHAHFHLGTTLFQLGRFAEAERHLAQTLALRPLYPRGHFALGGTLSTLGRYGEALVHYQRAVQAAPRDAAAHFELAMVYSRLQRFEQAAENYRRALDLDPDCAECCTNLAFVLDALHRDAEAIGVLRGGLATSPDNRRIAEMLAWFLATNPDPALRNGDEAIELVERAMPPGAERLPQALNTKAAALAELGRFAEAIDVARQAVELARQSDDRRLIQQIEENLRRFESGEPVRR